MPSEAWLAVLHAGQTGSQAWRNALAELGTVEQIAASPTHVLKALGLSENTVSRLKRPDSAMLEHTLAWLDQPGHGVVTIDDDAYPGILRQITDSPLALWHRGELISLLDTPQIAIVGSRNATRGGLQNATDFAKHLGEQGLTITSGLALGVDGAGHRGALGTLGSTIAVLGSGLDVVYPPQHAALAAEIEQSGLILSEYPPGVPPSRHHFPARNRIIAGLSIGVLVVEAGSRSGSLITARLAAEYGREVFAIPGSIHNPLARGCHRLIRDGAKLVDDAPTVLIELAPLLKHVIDIDPRDRESAEADEPLDAEYVQLLDMIGYDPVRIDVLTGKSGLTTAEVSSMLLLLELDGLVEALSGGRYARTVTRR